MYLFFPQTFYFEFFMNIYEYFKFIFYEYLWIFLWIFQNKIIIDAILHITKIIKNKLNSENILSFFWIEGKLKSPKKESLKCLVKKKNNTTFRIDIFNEYTWFCKHMI